MSLLLKIVVVVKSLLFLSHGRVAAATFIMEACQLSSYVLVANLLRLLCMVTSKVCSESVREAGGLQCICFMQLTHCKQFGSQISCNWNRNPFSQSLDH
jgi:hypothetical protein